MKKFVIKGVVFFCAAILSQAAANPDELTTVHPSNDLSRKILFPVVEEIRSWLSGLLEMSEKADYVTEKLKEYDESLIEVEKLRTKAEGHKAAGDKIQADLYEAKAVQAVVSAQSIILTDVINILSGLIVRAKSERISEQEQEKEIQEQAEKHLKIFVFKRNFDLGIAQCEAKALLYKAEAAQYAASGQLDVAEKYKEAAKGMTEAAKLLAEGKKYEIAGDEVQANSYGAESLSLYFDILRNVKRGGTQKATVTLLPGGTVFAQRGEQSRDQNKKALESEETANGECRDSVR